jgi:hypothetical protein
MARFVPLNPKSPAPLAPAGVLAAPGLQGLINPPDGPGDGAPAGPSGSTGATSSGGGSLGVGPSDGTGTGLGPGVTAGQAASAALSGARTGAVGQALGGVPGAVIGAGVKFGAGLLGVPSVPLTLTNAIIGAARAIAEGNLKANGQRVGPVRFGGPAVVPDTPPRNAYFSDPNEPLPDMGLGGPPGGLPDGLTSLGIGLASPPDPTFGLVTSLGLSPTPDPTFGLPDLGLAAPPEGLSLGVPGPPSGLTSGFMGTVPSNSAVFGTPDPTGFLGDPTGFLGDPTGQDGTGGGPTSDGGLGEGSGASGPGGDAAWFHGGRVHGPPGRDQVPGWLTDQEFVVDRDSAQRFPGLVRTINEWEEGDPIPRGLQGLVPRGRR